MKNRAREQREPDGRGDRHHGAVEQAPRLVGGRERVARRGVDLVEDELRAGEDVREHDPG